MSPSIIVHLAAIIPPPLYRNPGLARKVNVDATVALVRAAEAQPNPPRFVQASSNAVYGPRNPHRVTDVVRADTPPRPFELYSNTKFEAEQHVRSSSLEWVVLRLGGVLSPNFSALPLTADGIFIESALPTDGRIHTVDVRDVGAAFAAATTADVAGEILLIAGDDSHKLLQKDVGPALAAALGLPGVLPKGDGVTRTTTTAGSSPTGWTPQGAGSTGISAPFVAVDARRDEPRMGWKRNPLRLVAPLARVFLARRAAYRNTPDTYADVWGAIAARLGDPCLDKRRPASRGPAGSRRSAGCGATRLRPAFRRRRGSSDR